MRARLTWPLRRERVVRVHGAEGAPVEREVFFRTNVYRRRPHREWPLAPENPEPLAARHWVVTLPAGGAPEQFTVRLVDRAGNEGPAAPPVTITPAQARP